MAALTEIAQDFVADHGHLFSCDAFASLPSSMLQLLMFKLSAADLDRLEDIFTSRGFDVDSVWRRHCEVLGKNRWKPIEDDFGETKYMASYKSIYHYRQFHSLLGLLIIRQRCATEHCRATPLDVYNLSLKKLNHYTESSPMEVEHSASSYKAFLLKWSTYCEKLVLNGSDIRYIVSDADLLKELVKHLKFLKITVFSRHSLQDTKLFVKTLVKGGSVEQIALPGPSTMSLDDEDLSELMDICSGCWCCPENSDPMDTNGADVRSWTDAGGALGDSCRRPSDVDSRESWKGRQLQGGGEGVNGADSSSLDTVNIAVKRKAEEQRHGFRDFSSKRRKTSQRCSEHRVIVTQANVKSVSLCNENAPSCHRQESLNTHGSCEHLTSSETRKELCVPSSLHGQQPVVIHGSQVTLDHCVGRPFLTVESGDISVCNSEADTYSTMAQHRIPRTCQDNSSHRTVATQHGNDSSTRAITTQDGNDSSHITVTMQHGNDCSHRTVMTQHGQVVSKTCSDGIQGFILNGNSAAGEIFRRVLPHWTNLRRLSICFSTDIKDTVLTLVRKGQLTHLVLDSTKSFSVFESLVLALRDRSSLENNFQPMELCQVSVAKPLICIQGPLTFTKRISAVRVLDLSGNQFRDDAFQLLLGFITANTALTCLKLTSCGLSVSDSCDVFQALNQRDCGMEALYFSDNPMDGDGCGPMLLHFLDHNTALKRLVLSNVRLSKLLDSHPALLDALTDHPTLEVLDISRNDLGHSRMKLDPLERILTTSTAVKDLNIEMNQYKGSDLIEAADRVAHNTPRHSLREEHSTSRHSHRLDTLRLSNNLFTLQEQVLLKERFSQFSKNVLVLCTGMYHESLEHLAQM